MWTGDLLSFRQRSPAKASGLQFSPTCRGTPANVGRGVVNPNVLAVIDPVQDVNHKVASGYWGGVSAPQQAELIQSHRCCVRT